MCASLRRRMANLESDKAELEEAHDVALQQLSDLSGKHDGIPKELEVVRSRASELEDAASQAARAPIGRPKGRAGRETTLEKKWDKISPDARRKALMRHTAAICTALMAAGSIDWMPSYFALALKSMGIFEELMSTKLFAASRLQLVRHLLDVLSAE
eukprot:3623117-Pleurochrysis_carterae.AAC.1